MWHDRVHNCITDEWQTVTQIVATTSINKASVILALQYAERAGFVEVRIAPQRGSQGSYRLKDGTLKPKMRRRPLYEYRLKRGRNGEKTSEGSDLQVKA
jgi:hypothetical protein